MKKIFTPIFLFAALAICKPDFLKAQVNVNDSLALVDLYNSTDGPRWAHRENWLTSSPVSSWYGITVANKRVSEIDLNQYNNFSNHMTGTIPASLGNLSKLTYLDIGNNYLTGSLPPELGNLINLQYLDLYNNKLTGSIPSSLGNLINLQHLNFYHNKLTGDIPASLGNMISLQYLNLDHNQLSGSIPPALGHLINLTYLNLSSNKLVSIPSEIKNLKSLQYLYIFNNKLSGKILPELGELVNLTDLRLANNQLNGRIPSELGDLSNLASLYLGNNQLSGSIPYRLGELSHLIYLNLANNQLSGQVVPFHKFSVGGAIYLGENKFTFAGMAALIKNQICPVVYFPQANIPIHKNGNTLSVYTGGSYQLMYDTFKWYKGSTLVATITGDSTFTPSHGGNYSVTVTNAVATQLTLHSDTIYYNGGNNAIAAKMNDHSFIAVYPNPAKTNATLSFNAEGRYTLTITDLSGNVLQTRTGVANKGANSIQLDVSNYASGVYLITIIDEKNRRQTLWLNKE